MQRKCLTKFIGELQDLGWRLVDHALPIELPAVVVMVVRMKISLSCIYVQYRVKIKVQCFAGGGVIGIPEIFLL